MELLDLLSADSTDFPVGNLQAALTPQQPSATNFAKPAEPI